MYDILLIGLTVAEKRSKVLEVLNILPKEYFLATVHRAENADNPDNLKSIFEALSEISSKDKLVIVPLHPRTKRTLEELNLNLSKGLRVIEPLSYFDMLILEKNAKLIFTDSGGVQKEAYILRVPCITLREETEWIETVEGGWNILVGAKSKLILTAYNNFKLNHLPQYSCNNVFGDGLAGKRIVKILKAIS